MRFVLFLANNACFCYSNITLYNADAMFLLESNIVPSKQDTDER